MSPMFLLQVLPGYLGNPAAGVPLLCCHLGGAALNLLGSCERRHAPAYFVHSGQARHFYIILFLRLDVFPLATNAIRIIDLHIAKDMRMAPNHLFTDSLHHVVD